MLLLVTGSFSRGRSGSKEANSEGDRGLGIEGLVKGEVELGVGELMLEEEPEHGTSQSWGAVRPNPSVDGVTGATR